MHRKKQSEKRKRAYLFNSTIELRTRRAGSKVAVYPLSSALPYRTRRAQIRSQNKQTNNNNCFVRSASHGLLIVNTKNPAAYRFSIPQHDSARSPVILRVR